MHHVCTWGSVEDSSYVYKHCCGDGLAYHNIVLLIEQICVVVTSHGV